MDDVLSRIKLSANSAVPDHVQIARQIERLIRTGVLQEGSRLPPTMHLVKIWGVNVNRIQQAMDQLTMLGLLHRLPRRGTFVTSHAIRPMMGILLGPDLLAEQSHFYRLLTAALKNKIHDQNLNPEIYDGLEPLKSEEGRRSRDNLQYDIRHHQFNGIIQIGSYPQEVVRRLSLKAMPTAIFSAFNPKADVSIDYREFAITATQWLVGKGCRKLACFHHPSSFFKSASQSDLTGFLESAKAAGITTPHLATHATLLGSQNVDRKAYDEARQTMVKWRKERFFPDGIVISDDIAARGIVAAIQAEVPAGKQTPFIVVQTTDGISHFYILPVARYAISAGEIAEKLFGRLIDRTRKGAAAQQTEYVAGKLTSAYC